jgi:K319-like protein/Kelch motif protein
MIKKIFSLRSITIPFLIGSITFLSCQKKLSMPMNEPPVAIAGKDTTIILPIDSVTLDGRASYDPDGTLKQYRWSKISGPALFQIIQPESARATITKLTNGIYKLELKVTDDGALFSSDTVTITVYNPNPGNHAPVANAGQDLTIVLPANTAMLDGTGSRDEDNNIITFKWSKISGPSSFQITNTGSQQTLASSLVEGVYQFELKVADAGGLVCWDTMEVTVHRADITVQCEIGRLIVDARLVKIGSLSAGRVGLVSATAGSKIVFAGGMVVGSYSSRVDIYDTITKEWTTAELTRPERQGMTAASVGNKILFGGGGDNDWGETTSRVDIYDASNNSWSIAELSKDREYLAAATVGDKVLFAGGTSWETSASGYSTWVTSDVVDIYDNITGSWTTASLSQRRSNLTATTAGNKIYFAGGYAGPMVTNVSPVIDVFDASTNSWSASYLQQAKASHASVVLGDKIFWGAGIFNYFDPTSFFSNSVEIRDLTTGVSSHICIIPKINPNGVATKDKVVFFPGNLENGMYSGNEFDIYDPTTDQWSIGRISKEIYDATVISVNNTIYIAGGRNTANGPYFAEVWRLEF